MTASAPHQGLKPPLLEFAKISKRFGEVQALDGVSFTADAGRVLALMGENGAGKSTLLKILGGVLRPDAGELRLDGRAVSLSSPHHARDLGIRVIAQEPEMVRDVSIAENLFLGELPRGPFRTVDRRRLNEMAEAQLARFSFSRRIRPTDLASTLTAAERQLVEILRALRSGLAVLALDEPTSSLSDSEAETLFALVEELRAEGVAQIYISHRMPEVLRLADRVSVLRDGVHVGTEPIDALDEPTLIRMMVGRPLSEVMKHSAHVRPEPVLELAGITNASVQDISLRVSAGEVVGIAGLVGAGRSELVQTIFGDRPSESGTFRVGGEPAEIRSPADAIRLGIGYAPEERKADALMLEQTVHANGILVAARDLARFRVLNLKAETELMTQFVERLRIKTPSLAQPIGKLSGGNQQKVVLARWLTKRPRLLILDEPTRGIDVGAKSEIYALIEELTAEGIAVILVSSEMPEILRLSDRIYCMKSGRITGELLATQATEEAVLELCMMEETDRSERVVEDTNA
jgi:L-arabinose transport system ATP-binding protein